MLAAPGDPWHPDAMTMQIEVQTIPPRRYVGVRRVVKHDAIGPTFGEAMSRLVAWLRSQGVPPAGPPAILYHQMNHTAGDCDIEPALFVAGAVRGEGDIHVGEVAGGEALVGIHVGPYSILGQSWDAMRARAQELGRKVSQSPWEVYLDDPRLVALEELRTELYLPVGE
jgi:AraC family transcriptional regulator